MTDSYIKLVLIVFFVSSVFCLYIEAGAIGGADLWYGRKATGQ